MTNITVQYANEIKRLTKTTIQGIEYNVVTTEQKCKNCNELIATGHDDNGIRSKTPCKCGNIWNNVDGGGLWYTRGKVSNS